MKISYNWLKQYVNCDYSAEKVSEVLTSTGLEVADNLGQPQRTVQVSVHS